MLPRGNDSTLVGYRLTSRMTLGSTIAQPLVCFAVPMIFQVLSNPLFRRIGNVRFGGSRGGFKMKLRSRWRLEAGFEVGRKTRRNQMVEIELTWRLIMFQAWDEMLEVEPIRRVAFYQGRWQQMLETKLKRRRVLLEIVTSKLCRPQSLWVVRRRRVSVRAAPTSRVVRTICAVLSGDSRGRALDTSQGWKRWERRKLWARMTEGLRRRERCPQGLRR